MKSVDIREAAPGRGKQRAQEMKEQEELRGNEGDVFASHGSSGASDKPSPRSACGSRDCGPGGMGSSVLVQKGDSSSSPNR